ncbi:MAG TPA: ATP-binding cassette domain-containing protein [bacterium]|jgi:sulfate transport system ATP-binding protein
MSIVLDGVTKRFGSLAVVDGVHLEVEDGELYVLLGESGSGKSTVLRLIAGLTDLDAGRMLLHGRDVTMLPPQQRGVGLVFQNYSLFQHMTVAQNVEFGLMIRRVGREERSSVRGRLLELVGLGGLDSRYPSQLSGGQQQRVALARALAYEPSVLLLDEPFGALDATTRTYLRGELRRIQRELKITTIFVTHDREEAFELADRVGILQRGRLVASGRPEALYRDPSTPYVASLLGDANFLLGRAHEDGLRVGEIRLPIAPEEKVVEQGRRFFVHFRPEDVALSAVQPDEPGVSLGSARVNEFTFAGGHVKLRLRLDTTIPARTPLSPAEEESARTIVAVLPGGEAALLRSDRLWVGLKHYRVLPADPLRVTVYIRSAKADSPLVEFARQLSGLEGMEVRLLASDGKAAAKLLTDAIPGVTPEELDDLVWTQPGALWSSLRGRFPDILMFAHADAMNILRMVRPDLDANLRRRSTAVMAVPSAPAGVHRILVATAAGAPGREDLRFAARLARRVQAEVTLVHVVRRATLPLDLDAQIEQRVPQAMHLRSDLNLLASLGISAQAVLRRGDAAAQVLAAAEEIDAGIIIVGAQLPGAMPEGNISLRVLQRSTRPVAVLYSRLV